MESHKECEVKSYNIFKRDITTPDWQEQFEKYTVFSIVEDNKTFIISTNFKPEKTR